MNIQESRTRGIIAVIGAALAALLVVLFFPGSGLVYGGTPPQAGPCTDVPFDPTFLAYDAGTRGDNFGPDATAATVDEAQADLHQKRCNDAALVTAHAAYYEVGGLKLPMTPQQFESAVQAALDAPTTVWRDRVQAVEAYESNGQLSITKSTAQYETLFFRKGDDPSVIPMLYAGPVGDRVSTLFTVRHGNEIKQLKAECGWQPFSPDFPGTPNVPKKPKPRPVKVCDLQSFTIVVVSKATAQGSRYTRDLSQCRVTPSPSPTPTPSETPTPTPTPTPTETPTPGPSPSPSCTPPPPPGPEQFYNYNPGDCTWHKKPVSWECQQNGGPGCPPNNAIQPVQDNPTNQNTGVTPGAPAQPVVPAPGPSPEAGSPAPDPVQGGLDSGASNGSGTPGGTVTDSGGTTGGGAVVPVTPPVDSGQGGNNTTDTGGF